VGRADHRCRQPAPSWAGAITVRPRRSAARTRQAASRTATGTTLTCCRPTRARGVRRDEPHETDGAGRGDGGRAEQHAQHEEPESGPGQPQPEEPRAVLVQGDEVEFGSAATATARPSAGTHEDTADPRAGCRGCRGSCRPAGSPPVPRRFPGRSGSAIIRLRLRLRLRPDRTARRAPVPAPAGGPVRRRPRLSRPRAPTSGGNRHPGDTGTRAARAARGAAASRSPLPATGPARP
jgi:hypothetical protein